MKITLREFKEFLALISKDNDDLEVWLESECCTNPADGTWWIGERGRIVFGVDPSAA